MPKPNLGNIFISEPARERLAKIAKNRGSSIGKEAGRILDLYLSEGQAILEKLERLESLLLAKSLQTEPQSRTALPPRDSQKPESAKTVPSKPTGPPYLERIKTLASEGLSCQQIAEKLNGEGISSVNGKSFYDYTVRDTLAASGLSIKNFKPRLAEKLRNE